MCPCPSLSAFSASPPTPSVPVLHCPGQRGITCCRRGVASAGVRRASDEEARVQANIHMIVGGITLLLFLVTTILYALGISGRAIPAAKYVSYLASLFLFIQY